MSRRLRPDADPSEKSSVGDEAAPSSARCRTAEEILEARQTRKDVEEDVVRDLAAGVYASFGHLGQGIDRFADSSSQPFLLFPEPYTLHKDRKTFFFFGFARYQVPDFYLYLSQPRGPSDCFCQDSFIPNQAAAFLCVGM